jgi:hypothetical protein
MTNITMPNEIWSEVATHVDNAVDLLSLSRVSKDLNKVTKEERLWKRLYSIYLSSDWKYFNSICHHDEVPEDWDMYSNLFSEDYSQIEEEDRIMLKERESLSFVNQFKSFYRFPFFAPLTNGRPNLIRNLEVGGSLELNIESKVCWHAASRFYSVIKKQKVYWSCS